MRAAVTALAAVAATATAGAATARADARSEAQALFRVGQAAFDAGHYDNAADAFEQAYAKLALPAIAFSAAQAQRLQYFVDNHPQRLARAVSLYHVYLDQLPDGPRRSDAVANIAQIEPLLHALEAAGASLSGGLGANKTQIMVTADVTGAHAIIDDGDVVTTPITREVEPGDHTVVVTADGYEPWRLVAPAVPHAIVPVEAHLVAKPARLSVHAPSGALVSIDGRLVGQTPLSALDIVAGKHLIAVGARGHEPFGRDVVLARGTDVSVDAELVDTRQRVAARWLLIGSGAIALGAAITGVTALVADSDASAALAKLRAGNAPAGTLATYDDARGSRDVRVEATEIVGGIAVTAALTGLALYLFDEPVLGGHF